MVVGLQNGLTSDYGPPTPEGDFRKGKKKQKDKQKKIGILTWKKDRSKSSI